MSGAAGASRLSPRWFDVPNARLAALEAAPGRVPVRGPALLVPGYTGSKEDFLPIIGALSAAGHPVVALDQRGQFESSHAAHDDNHTIERLAQDLHEVVRQLDHGRVHLVGHSFGGLVARAAVLAHPSAFGSLTLLGSGPAALPGMRGELVSQLVSSLERDDPASAWRAVLRLADLHQRGIDFETLAFLRRRFERTSASALLAMGRAVLSEHDRVEQLREVAISTLVVYGARDDGWPPDTQADMARRLRAPSAAIEDAAHSPAVEQPHRTADAMLGSFKRVGFPSPSPGLSV